MAAIFIQSSMSQIDLPDLGVSWSDKILHFSVFGLLGWLVARGFHHSRNKERQKKYFQITVLICLAYAASDEFHQYWVPGRIADIYDFFADLLGIIVFAWLYKKWHNGRTGSMKNIKPKIQNIASGVE